MKRMSLQWRLTCIITLYIALICGCLTLLVYKNGVYEESYSEFRMQAAGKRYYTNVSQ